jgi:hypothetical protein
MRRGHASQSDRWMMLKLLFLQHPGCLCRQPLRCVHCHDLRECAKDCLRPCRPPLRLGQPRLDGHVAPASFGHDRPLVSDDRSLPMTTATDGGLDLTLSAIDALVVVALVATKSAIVVVLRSEEGDFTLRPASPRAVRGHLPVSGVPRSGFGDQCFPGEATTFPRVC